MTQWLLSTESNLPKLKCIIFFFFKKKGNTLKFIIYLFSPPYYNYEMMCELWVYDRTTEQKQKNLCIALHYNIYFFLWKSNTWHLSICMDIIYQNYLNARLFIIVRVCIYSKYKWYTNYIRFVCKMFFGNTSEIKECANDFEDNFL